MVARSKSMRSSPVVCTAMVKRAASISGKCSMFTVRLSFCSEQILPFGADPVLQRLARLGDWRKFIEMVIRAAGIDDRLRAECCGVRIGDVHRIVLRPHPAL